MSVTDHVDTLSEFARLQQEIVDCQKCPRLLTWCQQTASEKVRRFQNDEYWGKPVPSFGDPYARMLILGLAPAAHGANRTGRMFTGDKSGEWLYRALYKAGFASREASLHRDDDLVLVGCLITAVNHCAPPANKPLNEEMANCRPYLARELKALPNLKIVLALGKIAFDTAHRVISETHPVESGTKAMSRPVFSHGARYDYPFGLTLLASYHPSQQNTFTGKLTEPMFDSVFQQARAILDISEPV